MLALIACCLVCLGPPQFTEYHVIGDVGTRGRTPAHTDAVEMMIVDGTFSAPTAGENVPLPNGESGTWKLLEAGENGAVEDPALRGGYAHAVVEVDAPGIMFLDARGHSMVYVNGVPRGGDPYGNGLMRIPVDLEAGENEFLFRVGRGRLQARLLPPPRDPAGNVRPLVFMDSDDTLPDVVVGTPVEALSGMVVANLTDDWLPNATVRATGPAGEERVSFLGPIPPKSKRKIPVTLFADAPRETGTMTFDVALLDPNLPEPLDERTVTLKVVDAASPRKVTFASTQDGSVQYYGLVPANPDADARTWPGILLTLHGAGVNAFRQASCYQAKPFAHVVAPSNRRPFGFDWEDWGRRDALEALDHAQQANSTDPRKQWLTGHSMGGHGTWQIAAQHPDRFAAIAPSAGWVSFYSYGTARPEPTDALGRLLARAASASDTLLLKDNYHRHGIYILHGDKDDNVPVTQARTMRSELEGHPNLRYHEEPGAGHWWGNQCMDWPPLVEFLSTHALDATGNDQVDFTTVDPGVSSRHDWIEINAQEIPRAPARIIGTRDVARRAFDLETENVTRLRIFIEPGQGPWSYTIDGQVLETGQRHIFIDRAGVASFVREGNRWMNTIGFKPREKNPRRTGMFKSAFDRNMVFVTGTVGSEEETRANAQKAILDAETFLYRGNGSPEVVRDIDFDPQRYPGRNVILYGNIDTNSAWRLMLPDSPVVISREGVTFDGQEIAGDDLAVLLVRPDVRHPDVTIGAVAGTSPRAMRLTGQLPYFVSGVHYPDVTLIAPEMLRAGEQGIRAAGFFGTDWSIDRGDFEVRPSMETIDELP